MSKTAVITGASGGIGFEILKTLAFSGYDIIAQYNSHDLSEKISEIERYTGVSITPYKADFLNESELDGFCEFISKKNVDVLVNNAAVSVYGIIQDMTSENIDKLITANLKTPIILSKAAAPFMISQKKGSIVNISSVWGQTGASCETVYSATKAGIIGFTKALAKELAPSGVRVNCVAPGVVKTDMLNIFSKEDLEALEEEIPVGRLGRPKDVASAVSFLISDAAGYVTGEILSVNGGFYM